jgi:CRP-like cAMP-binding protein
VVDVQYLFRQGDQTNDFFIMLSGAIEIIVRNECTDRVIARHVPGRFIGELSLASGVRLFVSVLVVEGGEVATHTAAEQSADSLRLVGSRFFTRETSRTRLSLRS